MKKGLPKWIKEEERALQDKAKSIDFADIFVFLMENKPYESPIYAIYINDVFYGGFDCLAGIGFMDRMVKRHKVWSIDVCNRCNEMIRNRFIRNTSSK